MTRRIGSILLTCLLYLFIGILALNHYFEFYKPIEDSFSTFSIFRESSEPDENLTWYCNTYLMDLRGYQSYDYYYANGELKQIEIGAATGIDNSVFTGRLAPVYQELGIPAGDREALYSRVGRYLLYNRFPNGELFTFYNFAAGTEVLHQFLLREGERYHFAHPMPDRLDYLTLLSAADGNFYYLLGEMMPDDLHPERNRRLVLIQTDLERCSSTITHWTVELEGPLSRVCVTDFVAVGETLFLVLNQEGDCALLSYNTHTGEQQVAWLDEQVDFLLRDETGICYGGIANGYKQSRIWYALLGLDGTVQQERELMVPGSIRFDATSYFSKNRLYLRVQRYYYAKPKKGESSPALFLVIDTETNTLIDQIRFGQREYGTYIRFMARDGQGNLFDLPYTSNR